MKYEFPALTVIGSASGVLLGSIGGKIPDSEPDRTLFDGLSSLEAEW
jgi:hypothetical protein